MRPSRAGNVSRDPLTATRRAVAVVVTLGFVAAACGGGGGGRATSAGGHSVALARIESSPRERTISALQDPTARGLPRPLVDPSDIVSGGPPPDGIPAIDRPRFERAPGVAWLRGQEPVLALDIAGDARAYPVRVLIWHEIVNDAVGGAPVTVSYCPLCNSAVAFDRRVGNRVLDFGTSGELYNSDLVMYDRQTQSLWPQLLGQAVAGVLTGTRLQAFPLETVAWADWRAAHPRGWVLSRDTGFDRPYGRNPYPGYDDVHSSPSLFKGKIDGRLAAMTRVVGITEGGASVVIVDTALRRAGVVDVTVGGRDLVVWLKPGTASPLDRATIAAGRDVGATGVFEPVLDGRRLHFAPVSGGFRDRETGTTWDVLGRGVAGALAGRSLTAVTHVDTFWFAWAAFRPGTRIVGG